VEITETACPGCTRDSVVSPSAYRVVLWEQPNVDGIHPETIGWGRAVRDREYVFYANVEVLGEQALVQVAGRDPTQRRGIPARVGLKRHP
jgi:hypothetical protein